MLSCRLLIRSSFFFCSCSMFSMTMSRRCRLCSRCSFNDMRGSTLTWKHIDCGIPSLPGQCSLPEPPIPSPGIFFNLSCAPSPFSTSQTLPCRSSSCCAETPPARCSWFVEQWNPSSFYSACGWIETDKAIACDYSYSLHPGSYWLGSFRYRHRGILFLPDALLALFFRRLFILIQGPFAFAMFLCECHQISIVIDAEQLKLPFSPHLPPPRRVWSC